MKKISIMPVSCSLIALWMGCFIADALFGLMPLLSGKGFAALGGQYYRLCTGVLLHGNLLHLAINAVTLFWISRYLEPLLGSRRFLGFSALAAILAQLVYFLLLPEIDSVFGGSILLFAHIGLIAAVWLFHPDIPRLRLGTWQGNWILGYAILGNLPLFSFMNHTTVILHAVSFAVGFLLALPLCKKYEQS